MKTFLALVCVLCASPLLAADEEPETLFSGDIEHGGYGGPVVRVGSVLGEPAVFAGGYGGWFINRTIMLGGGGFGLVNNISAPDEAGLINGRQPSVGLGYGGAMIEFTGSSNSLVHYTAHLLVGGGGAGYYLRHDNDWDTDDDSHRNDSDAFFAMEFGVGVELNVASFFRINAGGSYLFVNGVELPGLADSDIGGPAAYLALKFGKF